MPPSRRNTSHLAQHAYTPTSVSRRVSFQVDHSPFISVDPSAVSYDAFPGTSAISPASTASPLPYSPHASPATVPRSYFAAEPEATTSTGPAQMFDAFSWSAAITPHDYASAPQPYTPGHPANVAHREAMEREAYEGADPDMMDNGGAAPSRKGSGSSRRRGSDSSVAASSSAGAGTSSAHAKVVTHTVKPKSHARKMSAGHILRPRNAFIIFRSAMIKDGAITENMEKDHGNISTICGMLWRKLSPTEKLKYQRMADLEKEQHRLANPGYKYAPKTRKEPPARRRQKKDQDVVAQRCALAAALLADGRRGSEMARQLEHFDKEVATQIKQEKEEAARLGIRPDPYAHAHSAKKLKRLEREKKERERALAAQASAANLREGVLAMHAKADANAVEKQRGAGPSGSTGPFSRTPRAAYTPPGGVPPPQPAPIVESAPSWTNPWASPAPESAMGRRPSSCPPPAAGAISIPALPVVPAVPVYDYVSPTQPQVSHLDMSQQHNLPSHHMNAPATAPLPTLHHPQPQNAGMAMPRRRSSSVPPPSLYAAPAQPFAGQTPRGWESGTRRPSVVFSMELERRPSQVQWNDDMGMGDARRPSMAAPAMGLANWSRRPSAMMWAPQDRRMSAQASHGPANNDWYSNGMTAGHSTSSGVNHLSDDSEPHISFGNYSFQTATTNGPSYGGPTGNGIPNQHLPPSSGPDQSYQFPPAHSDVEMYHDMNPSPFGAILAQQTHGMPMAHGWHAQIPNEHQSSISPVVPEAVPRTNMYSHAPHTPEGDYSHPHYPQPNQYAVPELRVHEPTWAARLNDHSLPHTPIGSSPHTGIEEEEGDLFQPFGEEVAFPALNSASREGSGAPERARGYGPQSTKATHYQHQTSVPLTDILNEHAIGPEDDLNAYSQAADNLGLGGYDESWKMLQQVDERFE